MSSSDQGKSVRRVAYAVFKRVGGYASVASSDMYLTYSQKLSRPLAFTDGGFLETKKDLVFREFRNPEIQRGWKILKDILCVILNVLKYCT